MKSIQCFLLFFLFLFGSCDYLDVVPEEDLETIESVFEKREKADQWLYTAYNYLMPLAKVNQNPAFLGADEYTTGNYLRNQNGGMAGLFIGDGLQMSQDPYGDLWESGYYNGIRYCNTFINNIDGTYNMESSEKIQWKAEVKALKAFYYFDLVRHYGPIVLVDENIPMESSLSEMMLPRVHVDTCIQEIVRLLDEALVDLLPDSERDPARRGYFCKESALMLKAKALLLAASPIFNGNDYYVNFTGKDGEPLCSTTYDPEKWRIAAEAIDEAVQACESYGRELYDGTTDKSTDLLNTMRDIEESVHNLSFNSKECLFAIKTEQNYSKGRYDYLSKYTLPAFLSTNNDVHNSIAEGTLSPSMKMVEMYYTANGLPIDQDKTWDYAGRYQMNRETDPKYTDVIALGEDVLGLHLRREPRFYACIAADRCYWRIGKDEGSVIRNYVVEARQGERFGTTYTAIQSANPQNINGYYLKKFLYSDLNSKNYFTSLKSQGDDPVPMMRMAELYLMQAEAWNEYGGPGDKVYVPLNKVRERAGIPDVETAWKTYSKTPGKVDSKEGMREIIQREYNIELAFEGQRFWNLRRWKTAHEELNEVQYGWNVTSVTAQGFYNNNNGPVVVWSKRGFVAPRDYLFPIRSYEVMVSSYVQNPSW